MSAVAEPQTTQTSRSPVSRFVNDQRNRSVFYQILVFGLFAWTVWYLFSNTAANLEARGMSSGFAFLESTSGFQYRLVDHSFRSDPFLRLCLSGRDTEHLAVCR